MKDFQKKLEHDVLVEIWGKHLRLKKYGITKTDIDLILNTYCDEANGKLPSVNDFQFSTDFRFDMNSTMKSFAMREMNLFYGYPLLTQELILSFKEFFQNNFITRIDELNSGLGYLSIWMKRYGIPIKNTVDNMTWPPYTGRYLDIVTKRDSIAHVKQTPETECYILSWPYMDNVAYRIWNAMKPGQYLIYIGEWSGGCTASDMFFEAVNNNELELKSFQKIESSYLRFFSIRDTPILFMKPWKNDRPKHKL